MKEAQLNEDEEMQDFDKVKELVPLDHTGCFEKSFSVYVELGLKNPLTEESLGPKPWDAYLTKVDLKNGLSQGGDFLSILIEDELFAKDEESMLDECCMFLIASTQTTYTLLTETLF